MDAAEKHSPQVELAQQVAPLLGAVEGVVAVVLGGSQARGEAHPDSDLDLGIYYRPHAPPWIGALRDVARRLDDRHSEDAVTDFGEWGPWIDGGAWLLIGGQKVDWLYRDLARVDESITESRQGHVSVHYQPGHPFGFPSWLYMGEISSCLPLYDPHGEIVSLKALTVPYPPALKHAIVDRFLWEASFALETAQSSAGRDDVTYVSGCLFRSVSCLTQVLFALNERYLINEKGAVAAADRFPLRVPEVRAAAEEVLSHPGRRQEELWESLRRMEDVVMAVRTLAVDAGG